MLDFIPITHPAKHPIRVAWEARDPDRVRVASAFATRAGVESLSKILAGTEFERIEKHWLIGIEDGVTQPEGLRRLAELPNSTVQVPYGAAILDSSALKGPRFFHAKLFALNNSTTGDTTLLSASANLTNGGLHGNDEQFLASSFSANSPQATRFDRWWEAIAAASATADACFIARYDGARPWLPAPTVAQREDAPAAELQHAQSLWVELTRRPEGGSFNQVELLQGAEFFFAPAEHAPDRGRSYVLSFVTPNGRLFDEPTRQMTFNGPPRKTVGNSMWRIYMPTRAEGYDGYQDGDVLIRFERTSIPGRFRIETAPRNSIAAAHWMSASSGIVTRKGPPPRRMGWS